jgi:hypothetical protein
MTLIGLRLRSKDNKDSKVLLNPTVEINSDLHCGLIFIARNKNVFDQLFNRRKDEQMKIAIKSELKEQKQQEEQKEHLLEERKKQKKKERQGTIKKNLEMIPMNIPSSPSEEKEISPVHNIKSSSAMTPSPTPIKSDIMLRSATYSTPPLKLKENGSLSSRSRSSNALKKKIRSSSKLSNLSSIKKSKNQKHCIQFYNKITSNDVVAFPPWETAKEVSIPKDSVTSALKNHVIVSAAAGATTTTTTTTTTVIMRVVVVVFIIRIIFNLI